MIMAAISSQCQHAERGQTSIIVRHFTPSRLQVVAWRRAETIAINFATGLPMMITFIAARWLRQPEFRRASAARIDAVDQGDAPAGQSAYFALMTATMEQRSTQQ